MSLRTLHRTSAIVVALFACLHIANHLASLSSISTHIAFMQAARSVYRQPVIESILLFCVSCQVVSGISFVIRGWKQRRGLLPWLQAISGGYLAFFFVVHVGAVMFGRAVLDLDTNFYFAAAGFHVPPYQFFFAPYYFFAVLALFTHIGCAAYWRLQPSSRAARGIAVGVPMLVGGVISLLVVVSLAGLLQPVEVPAKYKAPFVRKTG